MGELLLHKCPVLAITRHLPDLSSPSIFQEKQTMLQSHFTIVSLEGKWSERGKRKGAWVNGFTLASVTSWGTVHMQLRRQSKPLQMWRCSVDTVGTFRGRETSMHYTCKSTYNFFLRLTFYLNSPYMVKLDAKNLTKYFY